jgi:hypothetical protein
MDNKIPHKVMLSSTYREMIEHRRAVRDAMLSQRLLPIAMEDDAALPDRDLIAASLAKVDESDAYVGLIGYRYGQRPVCEERNPQRLSLTELEFRRAVAREIPICMLIMHDEHPVPKKWVMEERDSAEEYESFVRLAKKDRIYAEFDSIADLKVKALQSIVRLRDVLDARAVRARDKDRGGNERTRSDGGREPRDDMQRASPDAGRQDVDSDQGKRSPSHVLFAVAFLALSAICAWVLSRLIGERDVSAIVLLLFSLGFAFFAAVGILTLRRGIRHGD